MQGKRLVLGLSLLLLYLATATVLVYLSYKLSPPTNADGYKEFGVRAGIVLTAVGAFYGFAVSYFTLSTQLKAAKDLEIVKEEVTNRVAFKTHAVTAQSTAYDKAFVASENCYRRLQRLANGEFDAARVEQLEEVFNEAKALSANLPKEDQITVEAIQQHFFDIADEAKSVTSVGQTRTDELKAIWESHAKSLGDAMTRIRDRSLFFAAKIRPKLEQ